jgi:hypothetical protein
MMPVYLSAVKDTLPVATILEPFEVVEISKVTVPLLIAYVLAEVDATRVQVCAELSWSQVLYVPVGAKPPVEVARIQ